MASDNNPKDENTDGKSEDNSNGSRRNLLKVGLALGAVLVVGGVGAVARSLINPGTPTQASTTQSSGTTATGSSQSASTGAALPPPASPGFPVIKVANMSDLSVGSPVSFNYPLEEQPNFLVKLGIKAENGVGPDGDIVAFSQICQHLGCIYGFVESGSSPSCDSSYKASGPVGYCCCHGSVYDLAAAAKVIGGPAPRPEPQVILYFDQATGDIYATGMTPPTVFGFNTGSSDVSSDLQGGTLVS